MAEHEGRPIIRELERGEIEAILGRNHVGRIGYSRHNRVDIRPVHYVYAEGWIYGRTSYGSKHEALAETAHEWWPVAFEVDEIEDLFRWRSVLVHGGFYVLRNNESAAEREVWERALELLRTLIPDALRPGDPTPGRTVLFRIAVQEVAGREATPE